MKLVTSVGRPPTGERKRMQQSKKNVKSHVFLILKKDVKRRKNVEVITCNVLETTQSVFFL